MHTEVLEQTTTAEPRIDPDQFNTIAEIKTSSNLNELLNPSPRDGFSKEEYIYFLEPNIENILTVIRNISFAGEIVVLNSDVEYIGQIRAYLKKSMNLKAAFIIKMNEARKLQFWKIKPEEAGHVLSNAYTQEVAQWSLEAQQLTYDCGSLKGKYSTPETLQIDFKAGNFIPPISLNSTPTGQPRRTQNALCEKQQNPNNLTSLARMFERVKRTMLQNNPEALQKADSNFTR